MQGIDLPVILAEPGYRREVHARGDVQVDLPAAHVKGIHMSRLYRLLDGLSHAESLSPAGLLALLQAMVDSHRDCDSRSARIQLVFDLLIRRPALVTRDLWGWKSYPVRLDASLIDGSFMLRLKVGVGYSSTCPCSAALSRQLIGNSFLDAFGGRQTVDVESMTAWLEKHATLATPHSQRSEAQVEVNVASGASMLGVLELIERVEGALGTPLQTAVKRADEQEFAALNGQNLMFVEDAARRIEAALGDYACASVHVRHMESLHPHDAVAWAGPANHGVA